MKKLLALILAVILTITTFTSCAATDQALVSMYLNMGEKYLLDLNYEEAIVYFNKVIEVEPRNSRAYMGAAEAYVGLGDTESAINLLKTALEVFSDDEEVTIELLEMLIEIDPEASEWYITLAEIYEAKGDSDSAVAILSNAVEVVTDGDSLIVLLEKLIGLDPTNVNWYLKLAQVYVDSGDRTSAISILRQGIDVVGNAKTQLYDKLIEIDSDTTQWYFELAGVYEDQSNIPSAVDTLELGLNNFEDDDTKIDFSEELIEIDETNAEWYLTIAYIYIAQSDTDAAIAILREGLEKASDTTEIEALLEQLSPDLTGFVTTSYYIYDEDGTVRHSAEFDLDERITTYTGKSEGYNSTSYTYFGKNEYDSNGNEVKWIYKNVYSDGSTLEINQTYEYDSSGNMIKEVDENVYSNGDTSINTYTYSYDSNGNRISGTQTSVYNNTYNGTTYTNTSTSIYEYEYDDDGKLTMELQIDSEESYYYKYEYEYNSHGDISKATHTYSYAYDGTTTDWTDYDYEYDEETMANKTTTITNHSSDGTVEVLIYEYSYDTSGSIISRSETVDGVTTTYIIVREYEYDSVGRVSKCVVTTYYADSGNIYSVQTMERIN